MNGLATRRSGATWVSVALGIFIALTAVAFADGAPKPTTVQVGNFEVTFNGGFSPQALPKNSRVPIALSVGSAIRSLDGLHVPPLREMLIKADRNIAIDVRGYPVCKSTRTQQGPPPTTAEIRSMCGEAVVGEGEITIEIAFNEFPISVRSDLLVLNGGVGSGMTRLFAYAYLTIPVPASVVTTVKIRKIQAGRYGTLWTATIPKIAGGSGSIKIVQPQTRQEIHLQG